MSERLVFFFGAGASKAENAPVTSDLLLEALKSPSVNQHFLSIIKRFLSEFFRIENVDNIESKEQLPKFEELLTIVDVALLKQEELSEYWNRMKLFELREALVYCIARILRIKLQPRERESIPHYHRRFVESIFDDRINAESNENSFISLNYDILLDYALLNLHPNWDVDYGINFRNFTEPSHGHGIKLLKLHGSLNWMFCPVCNSMKLNLHGKIADRVITRNFPCEVDGATQRPLIIPPTWLKVYDNPHLIKIWLQAEHLLRKASAVFFIGYSLPESDIHVRYLLKKSLYRKNTYPRIIVITSPRNEEGSELHLRYKRFFGEVEYHPVGFEAFSEDFRKYISPRCDQSVN